MSYVPVRIGTLRPGSDVKFDVFVKVAEKYIHYIRNSEPFEEERLTRLKEKGVRKLFIPTQDEPNYLAYLDAGLDDLSKNGKSVEDNGAVAHGSMVTDAENIERNMETEQGYRRVETRVNSVITFLSSEKGALKSILSAAGCSLDSFQHSASVSSLSMGLALKLGGIKTRELLDLALAGLVHDLGKTKLGFEGLEAYDELDPAKQAQYRKHPETGVGLLASKKFITPGILRMVLEHEEYGEGRGYPEKRMYGSLPLSSKILSLCNHFDKVSIAKKIPPTQLVQVFFQEKADLFDLDLITQLGEVINGK